MRDSHLNSANFPYRIISPFHLKQRTTKKDGQFLLKGEMIKDIVKNEEILFNFKDGSFSDRC